MTNLFAVSVPCPIRDQARRAAAESLADVLRNTRHQPGFALRILSFISGAVWLSTLVIDCAIAVIVKSPHTEFVNLYRWLMRLE